jgi:polyketide biosynthesis acyl carrier protein
METTTPFDPNNPELLQQRIGEIIKQQIVDIMLDVDIQTLSMSSSMRELGLNSIDRVDVIMNTLETLGQNVPLVEFASARSLGDIVKIIGDRYVAK